MEKERVILYTQRVEVIESYGERRDCTDQRISVFLASCGFLPVPVPNVPTLVTRYLSMEQVAGVFLTGGNSLVRYGGDAPERDETERDLITLAIEQRIPVFGICRGMQFILDYFGAELVPVEGHVRQYHEVYGEWARAAVNSYHTMAALAVPDTLIVTGRSSDGCVEAVRHPSERVAAVMWHPERETPLKEADVEMIRAFYRKERD